MSKIKVGIMSAIIVAIGVTGVVEVRANREMRAELGGLSASHQDSGRLQKENQQLNSALQKLGEKIPRLTNWFA